MADNRFISSPAVHRVSTRAPRFARRAGIALTTLAPIAPLVWAIEAGRIELAPFIVVALLAVTLFALGKLSASRAAKPRPAKVELSADGIVLHEAGAAERIRRRDVASAVALSPHETLSIQRTNGARVMIAATSDERAQMISHLGFAVSQRAMTAPLRRVIGPFVTALLMGIVALGSWGMVAALTTNGTVTLASLLGFVMLAVAAFQRFGSPRVVVGADGVRIVGGWQQRFISYAEITEVNGHVGVTLTTRKGIMDLPVIGQSHEQIDALVSRIDEARRAFAALGRVADISVLARAGRTVGEWKTGVQKLMLDAATFRNASLSREDLEAIVANPAAGAEHRIGAAIALHALRDDVAATRVRVAVEATASPRLRAALERAQQGEVDDRVVNEALAETQGAAT